MPATEPILKLRDALVARLNTELTAAIGSSVTVEPRYVPYLDADDLKTPKWIAVLNADSIDQQLRGLAPGELTIDVGFQAVLPPKAQRNADYFRTATLDAWVEMVGKLKALYRPEQPAGKLRGERIAGAEFRRYTNAPLYRQEMLVAHGIFISVVSLVYYFEHNDDDND
jgi:hypothetical protein